MARKRHKRRITKMEKEMIRCFDASQEEADKPLEREPGEMMGDYCKRLNDHTHYLKVKLGANNKSQLPRTASKIRKNDKFKEKSQVKRKTQKELKKLEHIEKEMLTDRVKFGEVVLKPPQLKTEPFKGATSKKNSFQNLNFMKQFQSLGNQFSSKS